MQAWLTAWGPLGGGPSPGPAQVVTCAGVPSPCGSTPGGRDRGRPPRRARHRGHGHVTRAGGRRSDQPVHRRGRRPESVLDVLNRIDLFERAVSTFLARTDVPSLAVSHLHRNSGPGRPGRARSGGPTPCRPDRRRPARGSRPRPGCAPRPRCAVRTTTLFLQPRVSPFSATLSATTLPARASATAALAPASIAAQRQAGACGRAPRSVREIQNFYPERTGATADAKRRDRSGGRPCQNEGN